MIAVFPKHIMGKDRFCKNDNENIEDDGNADSDDDGKDNNRIITG